MLYHISDNGNIDTFIPRKRQNTVDVRPVVWAINKKCLPNYLTPRQCPRVCFYITPTTSNNDILKFMPQGYSHCVVIQKNWHSILEKESIYLYTFSEENFKIYDEIAGYYTNEETIIPLSVEKINNPYNALIASGVAIIFTDDLKQWAENIRTTTFNWSIIKYHNI